MSDSYSIVIRAWSKSVLSVIVNLKEYDFCDGSYIIAGATIGSSVLILWTEVFKRSQSAYTCSEELSSVERFCHCHMFGHYIIAGTLWRLCLLRRTSWRAPTGVNPPQIIISHSRCRSRTSLQSVVLIIVGLANIFIGICADRSVSPTRQFTPGKC